MGIIHKIFGGRGYGKTAERNRQIEDMNKKARLIEKAMRALPDPVVYEYPEYRVNVFNSDELPNPNESLDLYCVRFTKLIKARFDANPKVEWVYHSINRVDLV